MLASQTTFLRVPSACRGADSREGPSTRLESHTCPCPQERLETAERDKRDCGRLSASRLFWNLLDWVEMPSKKSLRAGAGGALPFVRTCLGAIRNDSQGKYWAPSPGLGALRAKAGLMNLSVLISPGPAPSLREAPALQASSADATRAPNRSCTLPALGPHVVPQWVRFRLGLYRFLRLFFSEVVASLQKSGDATSELPASLENRWLGRRRACVSPWQQQRECIPSFFLSPALFLTLCGGTLIFWNIPEKSLLHRQPPAFLQRDRATCLGSHNLGGAHSPPFHPSSWF